MFYNCIKNLEFRYMRLSHIIGSGQNPPRKEIIVPQNIVYFSIFNGDGTTTALTNLRSINNLREFKQQIQYLINNHVYR